MEAYNLINLGIFYSNKYMLQYLFLLQAAYTQNFILNGGFQTPQISSNSIIVLEGDESVSHWQGNFELDGKGIQNYRVYFGQFIQVKKQSSYIFQNVDLPSDGKYNLSFYGRVKKKDIEDTQVQIYWNGQLQFTVQPISPDSTLMWLQLQGNTGLNLLKFQYTGLVRADSQGLSIDYVSLTPINLSEQNQTANKTQSINETNSTVDGQEVNQTVNETQSINETNSTVDGQKVNQTVNETQAANETNSTVDGQKVNQTVNETQAANETVTEILKETADNVQAIQINSHANEEVLNKEEQQNQIIAQYGEGLSMAFSLPISQIPAGRFLMAFLDDFWLYSYDDHEYLDHMKQIFETIILIEKEKWKLLNMLVPLDQIELPISNYTMFSRVSIVKNDGEQSLTKNLFFFFTGSIPLTILTSLFLYGIFKLTFNYKISTFFRRQSFLFCHITQVLLESNLAYFIFDSLSQLEVLVVFTFYDKVFMILSITFFFICIMFAVGYYFYVQRLKQQACYFIDCLYRCTPTFYYLMVKFSVRSVLKGCIHFFLHSRYVTQMMALAGVEVLVLVTTVGMDKKWEIFISKAMFCLYILYHSLCCLLNLSFAFEGYLGKNELQKIIESFQTAQKMLILVLMGVICLIVIYSLIPLDWIKPKKGSQSQQQMQQPKRSKRKQKVDKALKQLLENFKSNHSKKMRVKQEQKQSRTNNGFLEQF